MVNVDAGVMNKRSAITTNDVRILSSEFRLLLSSSVPIGDVYEYYFCIKQSRTLKNGSRDPSRLQRKSQPNIARCKLFTVQSWPLVFVKLAYRHEVLCPCLRPCRYFGRSFCSLCQRGTSHIVSLPIDSLSSTFTNIIVSFPCRVLFCSHLERIACEH